MHCLTTPDAFPIFPDPNVPVGVGFVGIRLCEARQQGICASCWVKTKMHYLCLMLC